MQKQSKNSPGVQYPLKKDLLASVQLIVYIVHEHDSLDHQPFWPENGKHITCSTNIIVLPATKQL